MTQPENQYTRDPLLRQGFNRRRFLTAATVLGLGGSAALQAACGGDDTDSTGGGDGGNAAKGANLSVFLSAHCSYWAYAARDFERANDATVKFTRSGFAEIPAKLTPAFQSGGESWDVVFLWRGWVEQYAQFLTPLSELGYEVTEEQKQSMVAPGLEAIHTQDKTDYGLPTNTYTYVLYGNGALLEQAGISELPTNYADFAAAAKELTTGDQVGYTDGWAVGYLMPKWCVWFNLNGGELYSDGETGDVQFDGDAALKATQDMKDLLPSMPKQAPTSPWGIYDVEAKKVFHAGKAAMLIDYPHLWYEARNPEVSKVGADNAMVGLVPGGLPGGEESAGQYTGETFGIPKTSPNKEAALELIKWFSTPDRHMGLITDREQVHSFDPASEDGLPAYAEDYESPEVPKVDQPLMDAVLEQNKFPGSRYGTRPAYQQIADTIEAAVSSVLNGEADVEAAHKSGQEKLNQIVDQEA